MIPIEKEVLDVIRWHRQTMLAQQHPGLADAWEVVGDAMQALFDLVEAEP